MIVYHENADATVFCHVITTGREPVSRLVGPHGSGFERGVASLSPQIRELEAPSNTWRSGLHAVGGYQERKVVVAARHDKGRF